MVSDRQEVERLSPLNLLAKVVNRLPACERGASVSSAIPDEKLPTSSRHALTVGKATSVSFLYFISVRRAAELANAS
jgi:hypothetical protein